MTAESPQCPRCGQAMDPGRAQYDDDGDLVCASCRSHRVVASARSTEATRERQTKGSVFPGAVGSFVIAVLSFIVEHRLVFFLFPIFAIVGGAGTAWTAAKREGLRAELGWRYYPTLAFGILAVLIGLLSLVFSFAIRG